MPELNLIPRVAKYFDMFQRSADLNLEGARLLVELLEDGADVDRTSRKLKDIEHTADENTHEIFAALNVSFVTPLDREDISELASALDDVIDWTEEAARRVRLYRLTGIPPLAQKLARVLLDQAEEVAEGIALLGPSRKADELEKRTREIHRLENEGDDLFADAIAGVYDGVNDVPGVIRAIRLSDLYAVLETATDKAEHVAVVMHNVALKHG
jgi:uncharacterized protein Yka (UPF0111/DUF47 family)